MTINSDQLDIQIDYEPWRDLVDEQEEAIEAVITACLSDTGRTDDILVMLNFTDDKTIKVLNREQRGQDKPTNVLSFPQFNTLDEIKEFPVGGPLPLGEVIFAYETITKEAREQHKTLTDHLLHLVAHGTLHLLGYDHITESQATRMESREREILADLGISDPYQ